MYEHNFQTNRGDKIINNFINSKEYNRGDKNIEHVEQIKVRE